MLMYLFLPISLDIEEVVLSIEAKSHEWAVNQVKGSHTCPQEWQLFLIVFLNEAGCQEPEAPVFLKISRLTMLLLTFSACTNPDITPERPPEMRHQ